MGTIVEKKLETAWKAAIAANTYITANSIPVYGYRDVSHERPQKCVVVKVNQCENVASPGPTPNSGLFNAQVELYAVSYIPDDETRATLEAIYQEIVLVVTSKTIANMTTYAGGNLSFVGWTMEKGSEAQDERVQQISTIVDCNVQVT